MAKKNPNAEETLGLMVDTIRDRILDRIDEVQALKDTAASKRIPNWKSGNPIDYRAFRKLEKQLKTLKRGLGGLLTSDPNAELKSGETWGNFVRSLLDENVKGEDLARRLGTFGAFVDQKRKLVPGKVGHHRTGLSLLRDILKDKPFDFRTKFKAIAKKNGYEIGEEFVDFIDPAAHKEFTTNVAGALLDKFGWGKAKEIPESLVQALSERYAHAMQFGGTNPSRSGFDIPIGYLKDGFDEQTLFNFAQPYLEASKRGADAGLQIDEILTKTNWETPEDLIKNLNKVALNQTDDLLDIFGNKLGTKLSAKEKAARQVNPEVLKKMGLSLDAINPEFLKPKPSPINKLLKVAKNPLTSKAAILGMGGAGVVLSELGAQARAEEAAANPDDKWLQAQLKLDQASAALDKAALTGTVAAPATGGLSLIPAAAAETGSLITGGTSLTLDAGRSLHKGYTKFKEKGKPSQVYLDAVDSIGTRSTGPHTLGQGKKLNSIQGLLQNIKNRTGLAAERFDPLAGEFGLSELIYDN